MALGDIIQTPSIILLVVGVGILIFLFKYGLKFKSDNEGENGFNIIPFILAIVLGVVIYLGAGIIVAIIAVIVILGFLIKFLANRVTFSKSEKNLERANANGQTAALNIAEEIKKENPDPKKLEQGAQQLQAATEEGLKTTESLVKTNIDKAEADSNKLKEVETIAVQQQEVLAEVKKQDDPEKTALALANSNQVIALAEKERKLRSDAIKSRKLLHKALEAQAQREKTLLEMTGIFMQGIVTMQKDSLGTIERMHGSSGNAQGSPNISVSGENVQVIVTPAKLSSNAGQMLQTSNAIIEGGKQVGQLTDGIRIMEAEVLTTERKIRQLQQGNQLLLGSGQKQ